MLRVFGIWKESFSYLKKVKYYYSKSLCYRLGNQKTCIPTNKEEKMPRGETRYCGAMIDGQ